jgi:hypothetical protein
MMTEEAMGRARGKFEDKAQSASGDPANNNGPRLDVGAYLDHYQRPYTIKTITAGTLYVLMDGCLFDEGHKDAGILQTATGSLLYKCFHDSCQGHTWQEARKVISGNDGLSAFMNSGQKSGAAGQKQRAAAPMIFTALDDLLAEPDEAVSWVWDGILPTGGLSVIVAKPKAGKSTFARNLAHSVAQGLPFLDREVLQGPVLYCAFEEKRDEVRKHFRLMGTKGPLYLFINIAPPDAMKQLEEAVVRIKPVLVIIDTLFKLCRIKDGNDYSQAITAIEPLLKLARESGAHLFTVHHAGKGDRQGGDSILGSTGIFASVDTAVFIKRGEKYRTVHTTQRYGDDTEETTLKWDSERKMVSLGETREEEDRRYMEGAIWQFLQGQEEPLTEAVIDKAVEGRTALKRKALRSLVNKGEVERAGKGGKNDPFKYSCSLVPDIYMGTTKQESESDETPNNGGDYSCSQDFAKDRKSEDFREQEECTPQCTNEAEAPDSLVADGPPDEAEDAFDLGQVEVQP